MLKLGIDEWIIQTAKSMYEYTHLKSQNYQLQNNPTNVSVGVHQGSALSPFSLSLLWKLYHMSSKLDVTGQQPL